MLAEFAGVLLILALAIVVASLMVSAPKLLGPKRDFPEKLDPFECGEKQIVSPKQRFSVKFYLVGMLFIVFDIEIVFMYPWAVRFRDLGLAGFIEMLVFIGILLVGFLYIWRKGALRWH